MVIASININSLLPHVDEIEYLLKNQGIDFLALNETKVDEKLPDNLFKIEGYKFIRFDRTRHGGGVAVYCRDRFKSKVREDIPKTSLEMIGVEVTPLRAAPFLVLSWYRPPSDPIGTFDKLEQVMCFLELEGKEIILLGDTNCDLSVNSNTTDGSVPLFAGNARHIKDMYESFGLTQLILEPTRETEQTSTLIDHIAVSIVRNISKSGVVRTAISDHYLVYLVRKYLGGIELKYKQIYTRQMKNFNEETFLRDLSAYDWSSILYCSEDINVVVETWSSMLSFIIETHAPMMQKRVSERYSPWLQTKGCCSQIKI